MTKGHPRVFDIMGQCPRIKQLDQEASSSLRQTWAIVILLRGQTPAERGLSGDMPFLQSFHLNLRL